MNHVTSRMIKRASFDTTPFNSSKTKTVKMTKALLGAYAKKMRDIIHEVQANETDDIVVHKLAEIAADCAWCDREYGEAKR